MEGIRYSRLIAPQSTETKLQPAFESDPASLADRWQMICNRRTTVCGAAVLSAVAACLLTIPQDRLYQAQTSIELQGLNENFLHMNEITPNMGLYSTDGYVQTQVDILQSRSLLRRAAQKANLTARLHGTHRAAFAVIKGPGGEETKEPGEKTIKDILTHLKVRTSPPTRVIRIVFDAPDPRLAADFTNALASEYMSQMLESRFSEGQNTSEWLSHIQEELKGRLQRSEDRLQTYMRNAG